MEQERAGTGESAKAREILEQVRIPTLPEAAVNLLTLFRRGDLVGSTEIVRVVELDPALSARLLKVANSAYFGQQRKVGTLTRAAVVLGNENLKVVALGFYLSTGWQDFGAEGFDLREFWRDCILRACLARELSKSVHFEPRELAFLAAMLQDLGTLILATHFGANYVATLQAWEGDWMSRGEAERAAFGVDHAEVATALARQWNFPDALVTVISRHCMMPPYQATAHSEDQLWQICHFCAAVPFDSDRQTAKVSAGLRHLVTGALGLSFERLSDAFSDSVEQFNALRTVFGRLMPRELDVAGLMQEASVWIRTVGNEESARLAQL